MIVPLTFARAAAACMLVFLSVAPAVAQAWFGGTNNQWNTGSNWSSTPLVPSSGVNTQLIFGAAPNGNLQNNIPGTFTLNRITFDTAAPPYTITGNALNFVTSTSSVTPFILQNSANTVTIGNNLVLGNRLTIGGTGTGTVTLSGTLSGAGGLTVSTPGIVILNSGSNSFGGDVDVSSGTLRITNPTAIPGGGQVIVRPDGELQFGAATGNNAAAPLSRISLAGTFRVPAGLAEYYVDGLDLIQTGSAPPAIDFSGSTNFRLHLTGAEPVINVIGNTTWTGGGTSSIQNDGASAVAFGTSSTITNNIRLLNGTGNRGFQLTGGGTLVLTNTGNTAHLEADASTLEVADMAYLGTGVTVLRQTVPGDAGTLRYTGGTATSTKNLMFGPGHARIWVSNSTTELTLIGSHSDAASGTGLVVAGSGTLSLTGTSNFNRPIFVRDGAVLSVPSLPNGGVAGPLGISSNAPSNLTLGFASTPGTLRYTGATATTDRGIFFSSGTMGTLEVSSPDANLSITGQIVGDTVTKTGPGRLTLGNGTNSFTDGVSILEGTLAISNRTAIPANANVAVGPDAEFRLEYTLGSNASAPIGALIMDSNARFTAENTLASSYFLNRIDQNGGRIELQGSSSFDVNLTGAGARIDLRGTVTWSGTSNSRIVNDTTAQIDLSIAPGGMLGNLIPLANGSNGHGFRLTGGGTIWVHTAESTADLTVADSTTLRFSAMENLGSGDITLHGGKLEYTGTSAPFAKAISLGSGGGTISVTNPATNVDWNAPITGAHTLTKAGRGSLLLIDGSQDLGGLVIDGGRVDVSNDAVLGRGAVVVNSAGTLRFRNNSTTGRTFILNGGTLEAPSGGTLALDTATINGGFLHSPGGGRFSVLDFAELYGSTMFGGTAVDVNGTAAFTNVTTGANIAVAVGQTLTLNRGLQTSSGTLNVHGIAIAPSGWESSGVIRITGGATPGRMTVGGAPLVLGGGSRTYIGANVAGQRGGTIDLGGGRLELNGGLLVNNGDFISAGNGGIQNGTVNVNYGSLAKGSGYYDSVNVTEGGKFAPGNSITDSGIGTLTLNSGSVYEFEINLANGLPGGGGTTPPQGWDRLSMNRMNVNSTAESPAIVQLVTRNASDTGPGTLPDFDPAQSYQWQAFQAEVFNGFAPDKFTFDTTQFANLTDPTGVGTFTLERSGSSVFVVYTPVPEPGLILVVVAGALAAARPARRLVLMASLKSQVG